MGHLSPRPRGLCPSLHPVGSLSLGSPGTALGCWCSTWRLLHGLAPFLPARALETPGPGGQQRPGQRAGAVQRTEQFSPGLTGQRDSCQDPERTAAEGHASLPAGLPPPDRCASPAPVQETPVSCALSLVSRRCPPRPPQATGRKEASLGPVSMGGLGDAETWAGGGGLSASHSDTC